ncbi:hypothetical protein HD806DRAFT_541493 [Xylariaceae sp. AK1471]|nr:hypothetical protein HD806DRAFT_541493 [Xylariaceae sp. AK1471]
MHIYSGKLNWLGEAVNERFTIVFPCSLKKSDPVCGFWRWTVDGSGNKNDNFYQFDAVLSENDTILTVTMSNKHATKADATVLEEVRLDSGNLAAKAGCTVYTGTLNCEYYTLGISESGGVTSAVDEMFVLIVPAFSGFNVPVIAT